MQHHNRLPRISRCSTLATLAALALQTLAAGAFAQGSPRDPSEMSVSEMEAEINQLTQEAEAKTREVEENLQLKEQHQAEYTRLNSKVASIKQESNWIDNEDAALNRDLPSYQSACQGQCYQDVPGDCDRVQRAIDACFAPYNQRVDRRNERSRSNNQAMESLRAEYETLDRAEDARVAEAKELLARLEYIEARHAALSREITERTSGMGACGVECKNARGDEAAKQCLAACFDRARSADSLPSLGKPKRGTPFFGLGSDRAAEDAVEDYK